MSTPTELRNTKFLTYTLKDMTTGAMILQGRAYQWDHEHTNVKDANSYTFVPPIRLAPGLMLLFKD